jgi:preprotein translocase subunit YajC
MIMNLILASSSTAGSTGVLLIWIVAMIALMYFLMIRPQKKEQNRVNAMLNDLEKGDSVVTTSGFYGVVLDITDEDVIVEFGNNKNCRIPMKKTAIAEVEKASDGYGDAPAEKKAENAKPADKKKAPAEDKFEKK